MEYLMTYGWAILVIVIVLAVLAFFLPKLTATPELCQFTQPGFSCSSNPAIVLNNKQVTAEINLENDKGQTVNVSRVLCTSAALADANKSSATVPPGGPVTIPAGASVILNASCVDKSGNAISQNPNTGFRGIIVVYYNFQNDVTTIERPADAVLTGTVLG
jgi:hypothetical protein